MKILCWFGFHKKKRLISEMEINVFGEGWDLNECERCGTWYHTYVNDYFDKCVYESTSRFIKDML